MSKRLQELREFLPQVDPDLQRSFPFTVEDVRDSGSGGGAYTIRGHASVFDKWSLDLGGFKERVLPGAFDEVLGSDPHVLHLWDHDSRYILSSTRNKTLELRIDPLGLHYWSKVAPTSYAADLRILLERQDISQSSFAFTVEEDEWDEEDGFIRRSISKVKDLYDVTTTAMGAYPTTDAALAVRSMLRKKPPTPVAYIAPATATTGATITTTVLPVAPDSEDETRAAQVEDAQPEAEATAPVEPEAAPLEVDPEEARRSLAEWKAEVAAEHRRLREYVNRVERE